MLAPGSPVRRQLLNFFGSFLRELKGLAVKNTDDAMFIGSDLHTYLNSPGPRPVGDDGMLCAKSVNNLLCALPRNRESSLVRRRSTIGLERKTNSRALLARCK